MQKAFKQINALWEWNVAVFVLSVSVSLAWLIKPRWLSYVIWISVIWDIYRPSFIFRNSYSKYTALHTVSLWLSCFYISNAFIDVHIILPCWVIGSSLIGWVSVCLWVCVFALDSSLLLKLTPPPTSLKTTAVFFSLHAPCISFLSLHGAAELEHHPGHQQQSAAARRSVEKVLRKTITQMGSEVESFIGDIISSSARIKGLGVLLPYSGLESVLILNDWFYEYLNHYRSVHGGCFYVHDMYWSIHGFHFFSLYSYYS